MPDIQTRLIHNHVLIEAACAAVPRTSPGYRPLRRALRTAIFSSISAPENDNVVFLFTEFLGDDAIGSPVVEEYVAAAWQRGCVLLQVNLECGFEENQRRMLSERRAESGKLVDMEKLKDWRGRLGLARCEEVVGKVFFRALHVEGLSATETAREVLRILERVIGGPEVGAEGF